MSASDDMYHRRRRHEYSDASDDELGEHPFHLRSQLVDLAAPGSNVDFGAVSLYIPALQITFALLMACAASILAGALSSVLACNAVRTVVLTALTGTVLILKPFRTSYARGLDIMFDTLRPAIVVYVVALVCEQLLHSCRSPLDEPPPSNLRHAVAFLCVIAMGSAGFWQAWHPQTQTDYPFVMTSLALLVLTIFAPAPTHGMGPLCDVPTTVNALERLARTLTFSWVYLTLAYACEPAKHTIGEVMLSATRATSGSVWTLLCNRWMLIVGLVQGVIVVFMRLHRTPQYNHLQTDSFAVEEDDRKPSDGGSLRDDESILSDEHTDLHSYSPGALGHVVVDPRDGVMRMHHNQSDVARFHEHASNGFPRLAHLNASDVIDGFTLETAKQKVLLAYTQTQDLHGSHGASRR